MKTKNKRGGALLWVIIILILAGVGALVWWLTSNGEDFDTTSPVTLTCENDNFCVKPEGPLGVNIVKCVETDGGENLYLKGKIELYDDEGNKYVDRRMEQSMKQFNPKAKAYEDFCISDKELEEWTCNPRDIEDSHTCLNGCQDGACIQ